MSFTDIKHEIITDFSQYILISCKGIPQHFPEITTKLRDTLIRSSPL